MPNYPFQYPYGTPTQQQMPQIPVIKGRPVASIEEARACMIDFDGSVFYFPDTAHQRIYTKQINLDGTSQLKMYEEVPIPQQGGEAGNQPLVTREEFEKAINDLLQQVEQLKKPSVFSQTTEDKPSYNF